jgi:hypothetical protein
MEAAMGARDTAWFIYDDGYGRDWSCLMLTTSSTVLHVSRPRAHPGRILVVSSWCAVLIWPWGPAACVTCSRSRRRRQGPPAPRRPAARRTTALCAVPAMCAPPRGRARRT